VSRLLGVHAVRRTAKVLAGVKVQGHVGDPIMMLSFDPTMSQDQILSYLLLGQPEREVAFRATTPLGLEEGDLKYFRADSRALYRMLLIAVLLALTFSGPVWSGNPLGNVIYVLDFSDRADGDAKSWLQTNGFQFKLDADDLNPHFSHQRLMLESSDEKAGYFVRRMNLPKVKGIRLIWGVDRYPQGADWERGIYRVSIAVVISFGEKKIGSGSFYIPDAPYFISLFLGEKEKSGRAYTGKYYKKGGRYFCKPCGVPPGETVVTEFDLEGAFKSQFGQSKMPPVSSFGFQMNTEDTRGGARAFLKKVEFLGDKT